jgi:large subunit ribosomal protein L7A
MRGFWRKQPVPAKFMLTIVPHGAKIAKCIFIRLKPSMNEKEEDVYLMPLEDIQKAKKIVVGTRQTTKAVESGAALVVYVAEDADTKIVAPLVQSCEEKGVKVLRIASMAEIGKACNIKVGAAMAAIIEY